MSQAGFDTYGRYLAVRNHFQPGSSYNCFKYNFKMRVKPETFIINKNNWMFDKLAKLVPDQDEQKLYLAATFFENYKTWIGDLLTPESQGRWSEFQKRKEAREYWFIQDFKYLTGRMAGEAISPVRLFVTYISKQPKFFIEQIKFKKIAPDTLIVMNRLWNNELFSEWSSKMDTDTLIWPMLRERLEKLAPFLEVNTTDLNNIRWNMQKEHATNT